MKGRFVCRIAGVWMLLSGLAWAGDDWPQFRGPDRDGTSDESGLMDQWPQEGPKQIWRIPIGQGYSAVSVVGDTIYTAHAKDEGETGIEYVLAADKASGEPIWETAIGEKIETEFGNGPRSTPTVDGDMCFTLSSQGNLAAINNADGAIVWQTDFIQEFGATAPGWGYATSALVDGDQVVIQTGGPEGKSLVALNKATGELKWGRDSDRALYNSILPIEVKNQRRYVCISADKLLCLDPKGQEIWSHPWPQGETHAMPIYIPPNRYYASGAEGIGAAVVEVNESAETAVTEVWKSKFIRNHFSSSVLHNGYLYGFDNATMKCVSAKDGELAWAKRGLGKGSLILADNQLYVLSDRGKLLLLEATPQAYTEKSSIQALKGRCWTAPSLSRGKLYLRNHTEMVCYDIKG